MPCRQFVTFDDHFHVTGFYRIEGNFLRIDAILIGLFQGRDCFGYHFPEVLTVFGYLYGNSGSPHDPVAFNHIGIESHLADFDRLFQVDRRIQVFSLEAQPTAGFVICITGQAVRHFRTTFEIVSFTRSNTQSNGFCRRFAEIDFFREYAAVACRTNDNGFYGCVFLDLYGSFIFIACACRFAAVECVVDITVTQGRESYDDFTVLRIGGEFCVNVKDILGIVVTQAVIQFCHTDQAG